MSKTQRELEGVSLCDLGETIQGASYVLATVTGLDKAVEHLRKKAGEAFSAARDSEAHLYRNLAKEFEEMSKKERAQFDTMYTPRERAAFEELEARDREQGRE